MGIDTLSPGASPGAEWKSEIGIQKGFLASSELLDLSTSVGDEKGSSGSEVEQCEPR